MKGQTEEGWQEQELDQKVEGEDEVTINGIEQVFCKSHLQVNSEAVLHCMFCNNPFLSRNEKTKHMNVHFGKL